jgi:hypothetical protein
VVIVKLNYSIYVGAYIALICGDIMISMNPTEEHKSYNGRQSRYATTGVAICGELCACLDLRYREERRTETRDIPKRVVYLVHCHMPIVRLAREVLYMQQLGPLVSRVC